MTNLIAGLIVIAAFLTWGLWLCDRRWIDNDLDAGFFWSVIPVAIALWISFKLIGV